MGEKLFNFKVIYSLFKTEESLTFTFYLSEQKIIIIYRQIVIELSQNI